MGPQSTGVATTDSLPTEGVPQVEQLRRVGSDSEGQGGVSSKRKRKKKLVTSSSWQPVQQGNIATFIVAPLLVIIWPFFFFFFSSQPDRLVLTCHSAHKESMWVEKKKNFLFIAALLATPHIRCVCVCAQFAPVLSSSVLLTFSQ